MDLVFIERTLETDFAYHVYAISSAVIVLATCAELARREVKVVRALSPHDFTRKFSGKEPWSCDGLQNRIDVLTNFRKAKLWNALRHVGALVILGFVVPSLILGAAVVNCAWLFGGQSPFVTANGAPLAHPTIAEAAIFVLAQFSYAISDVLEIFHIDIGHVAIANGQYAALTGILGYRLFVGAFALATVFAIYILVRVGMGTDRKIDRLQSRRKDACKMTGATK